jgi:hypothetical protein
MGQTRKIRKPLPKVEQPPVDLLWTNRFIIEGDRLFTYMTENYESLFVDKKRIRHFYLREDFDHETTIEEIQNKYIKELEQDLLVWIQNEHASGKLFQKELWDPVRYGYVVADMYNGYKRVFQFKHYFFRLAFESECELDDCLDCQPKRVCSCTYSLCNCMNHFSLVYLTHPV